jgi:hypothetical protein
VTTPLGGEGLVSRNNDGALLATTADEFAAAAAGLARDEALRRRIVDVGRQRIASHAPDRVATAAMEIYREAIARGRARGCGTQTLEDA